jgi:hypothetical protein
MKLTKEEYRVISDYAQATKDTDEAWNRKRILEFQATGILGRHPNEMVVINGVGFKYLPHASTVESFKVLEVETPD